MRLKAWGRIWQDQVDWQAAPLAHRSGRSPFVAASEKLTFFATWAGCLSINSRVRREFGVIEKLTFFATGPADFSETHVFSLRDQLVRSREDAPFPDNADSLICIKAPRSLMYDAGGMNGQLLSPAAHFTGSALPTPEYTTELEKLDEDTWHPHIYDLTKPENADQWGTSNPMNEMVAKEMLNDVDRGVFVAPPV